MDAATELVRKVYLEEWLGATKGYRLGEPGEVGTLAMGRTSDRTGIPANRVVEIVAGMRESVYAAARAELREAMAR